MARFRLSQRRRVAVGQPAGEICIGPRQVAVHKATEAMAVAVMAPFLARMALRRGVPKTDRALLLGMVVGTLIVDGGLLLAFEAKQREAG